MRTRAMFAHLLSAALLVAALCAASSLTEATLRERFLLRRQSVEAAPVESATLTPQSPQQGNQIPARLYPDLPHFDGPLEPARTQFAQSPHGAPQTPFVPPFALQPVGETMLQQPPKMMPPTRMATPSERLQSQSFTSGLGRRLMSMFGFNSGVASGVDLQPDKAAANNNNNNESAAPQATARQLTSAMDETMRALQNSTLLQQLNNGVHSIYGNLAKAYNSTVQQQLNLLQERFKKESENSTQPWQQRMAQQVPLFFKSMAVKVNEAQENLNRVWRQVTTQQAALNNATSNNNNNNNINNIDRSNSMSARQMAPPREQYNFFDQFMGDNSGARDYADDPFQPSQLFNQIGRTLGIGEPQMNGVAGGNQPRFDLAGQLMEFWHNQVQPQIGMVRNQVMRVWRELSSSGMMAFEPMMMRSRASNNNALPQTSANNASNDLVDNILKDVQLNNADFALLEPKNDEQQVARAQPQGGLSNQMQNNVMSMQREINKLWGSLTSSLQSALQNVKLQMNPAPNKFNADSMSASSTNSKQLEEADPAENEIGGKLSELSKLQREADAVAELVRQQQAQQQQRPTLGGRVRNFFTNIGDFGAFEQIPHRVGDSVSRFGAAVGDLWHQIPRRWDNLMAMRQPESSRALTTNAGQSASLTSSDSRSASTSANTNQPKSSETSSTAKP